MWPCKQNWMKKSQNMPVWLSRNGFGPACVLRLVKGTAKGWLPLAIDWLHSLIAQGGVPIRSLPRMCSSSFSFMGGVGKK